MAAIPDPSPESCPDPFPDLGLDAASRFAATLGLIFDVVRGDGVTGHLELGPHHHSAWGTVHGGVYSTVVERAASVGASRAVADKGRFAVGVHNATDVFVTEVRGPALVEARPVFQGELQQLWSVEIRALPGNTLLARGQLRLQNVAGRSTGHDG
ncbi:PaaI family thioesterase [Streptomyces gamaensis]|uniref:PaaI family thioesterase n=1 Tax=Streptomyces gamaensis TaxID=1763542 RepID=A0ABW0Z8L0_9ACTN